MLRSMVLVSLLLCGCATRGQVREAQSLGYATGVAETSLLKEEEINRLREEKKELETEVGALRFVVEFTPTCNGTYTKEKEGDR